MNKIVKLCCIISLFIFGMVGYTLADDLDMSYLLPSVGHFSTGISGWDVCGHNTTDSEASYGDGNVGSFTGYVTMTCASNQIIKIQVGNLDISTTRAEMIKVIVYLDPGSVICGSFQVLAFDQTTTYWCTASLDDDSLEDYATITYGKKIALRFTPIEQFYRKIGLLQLKYVADPGETPSYVRIDRVKLLVTN